MKVSRGSRRDLALMWLTFIVLPLFGFFVSLRSYASGQYRVFIFVFLVLYGYTFIPIPESDATRYIEQFNRYTSYTTNDFLSIVSKTYTAESPDNDFYASILLFLTTRISDDYRIFFLFQAFIYYIFALSLWKTIWELRTENRYGPHMLFFVGTIFVLNISAGLNGIRFPLGFMVFSFGALKYIITNGWRFLFLALLSVFVHFSMLYPSVFLLMFSVFQRSKKPDFIMVILIIVLFASSILSLFISDNIGILGAGLQNKLNDYTSEGFLESRGAHVHRWNWYVQFSMYSTSYFVIAAVILSWIGKHRLKVDVLARKLFLFTVLLLIQCILSGTILDPITNNRYFQLMSLFGLITIYYLGYLNQSSLMLKIFGYIFIPILLMKILIVLRTDLYTISPILIFGNIFVNFFLRNDISIYELLFG